MIVTLSLGLGMNILIRQSRNPPIVALVVLVVLARGFPAFRVIFYYIRS
jgi:hypothetical protein